MVASKVCTSRGSPREAPKYAQVLGGEGLDSATTSKSVDESNRVLRKAETVIQRRTDQLIVLIERTNMSHNYSAVLRTCEALGVHGVWCINPPSLAKDTQRRGIRSKKNQWKDDATELDQHVAFARGAAQWLDVREFSSTADAVSALRADGRDIWVTDLSQHAQPLSGPGAVLAPLPSRLCICFGSEQTGASPELLGAADKRVYLPLHGFADSLNLSVAAALVVFQLLSLDPTVVGKMTAEQRAKLRKVFYPAMARSDEQKIAFADIAGRVNADATIVVPFSDLRRPDDHRKHLSAHILTPSDAPAR